MKRIIDLINKNILSSEHFDFLRKKNQEKKLLIITISREKGSGGRPIAFLVAKKLGKPWKVYHEEIVVEIAKESHLEKKLIKEVDEKNIPAIDSLISSFFGKRYMSLNSYHQNLTKVISTIGHRGNVIIVGRGANFLFPDALNIRIICEMNQRIEWLIKYENISKKEAIKRIEESDNERIEFIQKLFHHDVRKAHHYDLIICTGKNLSIEDAANLIFQLAKKRFSS
jgi:cytidylate kinase